MFVLIVTVLYLLLWLSSLVLLLVRYRGDGA